VALLLAMALTNALPVTVVPAFALALGGGGGCAGGRLRSYWLAFALLLTNIGIRIG